MFGALLLALAASPSVDNRVSEYSIEGLDDATMRRVADQYSIEGRRGDAYQVYVPLTEVAEFEALVPSATLLARDNDAWMRNLAPSQREGYLELDEYKALFEQYERDFPDTVRIATPEWMKTEEGREIMVLEVSGRVHTDNPKKPAFVFTGSTHGDEWISTAVAMGVLDRLLARYGSDPRVTKLFDWTRTFWIPAVSPDSYHKSRNVHGVDPNRMYPYPGHDTDGTIASAKNMIRWHNEVKPVASIDYHGVQGSVLWPWGWTEEKVNSTDYQRFDELGAKMVAENGYIHGQSSITIYIAKGATDDAWYYLNETMAVTVEVGANSKKPPESEIARHVDDNVSVVMAMIEYLMPTEDPNDSTDTGDEETDATADTTDGGDEDEGTTSGEDSGETTNGDDTGSDESQDSDDEDTSSGDDAGNESSASDESQDSDEGGDDDEKDSGDDDDDENDSGDGAQDSGDESDDESNPGASEGPQDDSLTDVVSGCACRQGPNARPGFAGLLRLFRLDGRARVAGESS